MKILFTIMLIGVISGCAPDKIIDVSGEMPHSKLVNTRWRLTKDAYLVNFMDNPKDILIVPVSNPFWAYMPNGDYVYDETRIGQIWNGKKIVGGLRCGEILSIARVLKEINVEMGTTYIPLMIPLEKNQWTKNKELGGFFLYRRHSDNGLLNPDFAERVNATGVVTK